MTFRRSAGKKLSINQNQMEDIREYFWIEALEANSTVNARRTKNVSMPLQYSLDKKEWALVQWSYLDGNVITLENEGDRVWFRKATTADGRLKFQGTGRLKAGGNLMYLSNYENPTSTFSFAYMFEGNASLVDATEIVVPSTTPTANCYKRFFYNCESLEHVFAALPAIDVPNYCYDSMFFGCVNLKECPTIAATTMGQYACQYMFEGCTSITQAPELFATTINVSCYYRMFYGCTSLLSAPTIHAETIPNNGCYYMFRGCNSLVSAGSILATSVGYKGCHAMFDGCSSLLETPDYTSVISAGSGAFYLAFRDCISLTKAHDIYIVNLANGTNSTDGSCQGMFDGCTSLVLPPKLYATVMGGYCYAGMFKRCTSLTTMPNLPSVELATRCYSGMFSGCTNLVNVIDVLPATIAYEDCYHSMFDSCSKITTSPEIMIIQTAKNFANGMFANCVSLRKIAVHFTEWYVETTGITSGWTEGLPSTGKFYKPAELPTEFETYSKIPVGWEIYNLTNVSAEL